MFFVHPKRMPKFSIHGAIQLLHDPKYVCVVGVDGCKTTDASAFDDFLMEYAKRLDCSNMLIAHVSSFQKAPAQYQLLALNEPFALIEMNAAQQDALISEFNARLHD